MINIDALYFEWLMSHFENPSPELYRVCRMLSQNVFQRRIGNDINRAVDGEALRKSFLDIHAEVDIDPRITNRFLLQPCNWFEMLVALAERMDYMYDGGLQVHVEEAVHNLGLAPVMSRLDVRYDEIDQELVDAATNRVDFNLFDADGHGGLFPLIKKDHPDQRKVEIWDQHAAYFRERLEGVMWTSTK